MGAINCEKMISFFKVKPHTLFKKKRSKTSHSGIRDLCPMLMYWSILVSIQWFHYFWTLILVICKRIMIIIIKALSQLCLRSATWILYLHFDLSWAKSLYKLHVFKSIFTISIHILFDLPLPIGGIFGLWKKFMLAVNLHNAILLYPGLGLGVKTGEVIP